MTQVRKAVLDDLIELKNVLRTALTDGEAVFPDTDDLSMIQWLSRTIVENATWVIEDNGRIVGSIGLKGERWYWREAAGDRPSWFLNAVWFYVMPEHRAGGAAKQLLTAARKHADEVKAPLMLSVIWGDADGRKTEWVKRQGLTYLGGNFMYEPASGD